MCISYEVQSSMSVNNILLEHSCALSFTNFLCLLSCYNSMLQWKSYGPQSLKYLLSDLFTEKVWQPLLNKKRQFRVRRRAQTPEFRQACVWPQHLLLPMWSWVSYLTSLSFSSFVNRGSIAQWLRRWTRTIRPWKLLAFASLTVNRQHWRYLS